MEGRRRLYDQIASEKQTIDVDSTGLLPNFASMTDADLYRALKQAEQDFSALIRANPRSILDKHRSYTALKQRLVESFSKYMTRPSTIENVLVKEIDERLWKCIKNELKTAEASRRGDSRAAYENLLMQNRDLLITLIRELTKAHTPLNLPNYPDCASRKALGQMLMGIGEIFKLK